MTQYNWKSTGPGGCDAHCIEHPCGPCAGVKRTLSLPCLYCGDPVPLESPSVACAKPACQDKEAAAYEGMD